MGFYGYIWVSVGLWVFMGVMGIYGCLCVSMDVYRYLWASMDVYGYFWVSSGIYGCLWVPVGVYEYLWESWVSMGAYGFLGIYGYLWVARMSVDYIWTLKILPIFSFKNLRRFENFKKRLKSHMCYKKLHHGGEGLYRLVCFQYSSIKSLFSPLVHNILFFLNEFMKYNKLASLMICPMRLVSLEKIRRESWRDFCCTCCRSNIVGLWDMQTCCQPYPKVPSRICIRCFQAQVNRPRTLSEMSWSCNQRYVKTRRFRSETTEIWVKNRIWLLGSVKNSSFLTWGFESQVFMIFGSPDARHTKFPSTAPTSEQYIMYDIACMLNEIKNQCEICSLFGKKICIEKYWNYQSLASHFFVWVWSFFKKVDTRRV